MPSRDDESIGDLLRRARAGDRAALDRLFACCRNYVAIVARTQLEGWLRAKADESDLVQQTFLEAYRGFNDFRGQGTADWLAWLRRILANNAVDFARKYAGTEKRQAGREVSLDGRAGQSAPLDPAAACDPPSQQLLAREREMLLAEGLARLTADHREVIVLRNLEGLPFDEVARRMGRSRPAVQMLWLRAIRNLKETMCQASSDVR